MLAFRIVHFYTRSMSKVQYANSHDSDVFYVVGFPIPDSFFIIEKDNKKYVFLDHREYGIFKEKNTNPSIEVVLIDAESRVLSPNDLASSLFKKYDLLDNPVDVPKTFPLDMADFLRAHGAQLNVQNPFRPERLKKTPEEVEMIRESLKRNCAAFDRIEEILHEATIEGDSIIYKGVPLTSEYLKAEVDRVHLEKDMLNVEGLIISCAEHAAIPHHPGRGQLRPHQTIICDIFPRCRSNGYFADTTRTYVKGKPSQKVAEMYDAVCKSQQVGFDMIKPGVIGGDVHRACGQVFLVLGFDVGNKGFTHGTGHGLGLDIHEMPYMNAQSTTILEPGHVMSVEPGLYYPEWGGVRIEDIIVVTEDGCENLTDHNKDYIIP